MVNLATAEWVRARRHGSCSHHSISMNLLVAQHMVGIVLNPREHREESGLSPTVKEHYL